MQLDSLRALDLTDRQVRIYHTLLRLGPASIRDVAAESGVNRGTTYETLKEWVEPCAKFVKRCRVR